MLAVGDVSVRDDGWVGLRNGGRNVRCEDWLVGGCNCWVLGTVGEW